MAEDWRHAVSFSERLSNTTEMQVGADIQNIDAFMTDLLQYLSLQDCKPRLPGLGSLYSSQGARRAS